MLPSSVHKWWESVTSSPVLYKTQNKVLLQRNFIPALKSRKTQFKLYLKLNVIHWLRQKQYREDKNQLLQVHKSSCAR